MQNCILSLMDKECDLIKLKYQEDGRKLWICLSCGKEFNQKYLLKRHIPIHTDERKFKCIYCDKLFRQNSTLSQHIAAIHSGNKPFVCEVCNKCFSRVSILINHCKTHKEKQHQCTICDKSFHQKSNLNTHMNTHLAEKPFKCQNCSQGFNQKHKMKKHMKMCGLKWFTFVQNILRKVEKFLQWNLIENLWET